VTYTVVLLREEEVGGYSVVVPALPGCFSQGETVREALDCAKEAILCHVRALRADGDPVPPDVETVSFEWGEAAEALAYRVMVEEAVAVA